MIKNHSSHMHPEPTSYPDTGYRKWIPLTVVFIYIFGLTAISTKLNSAPIYSVLSYLMGYFFIVFSLFKMIDISAFAIGYQEYDIIAKRVKAWGYIYPFIELSLGVMYLLVVNNPALHIITIIMSFIICLSVLIKLAKHEKFQCLCLGTVLKVPLTIVSLVEYAAMGIMAAVMLLGILN